MLTAFEPPEVPERRELAPAYSPSGFSTILPANVPAWCNVFCSCKR
jgi:hypothetical protein